MAKAKETPPWLRALGRETFPSSVRIADREYRFARGFKHDFFAATALYDGDGERIVVKMGRRAPFFGLPMAWIGRWLARHEADLYRRLSDLDVVPRYIGMWGDGAIAHEYVEGHVLRRGEPVPDDYFDRLRQAIEIMHQRDIAYVDLEKCENALVGADGRPYLFDFQISWHLRRRYGGGLPPARWLLRRLQQGDRYHVTKLQRRTRPDQLSPEALAASYRRPFYVRLHRWLIQPLQRIRRGILARVDPHRDAGRRGERGRLPDDGLG